MLSLNITARFTVRLKTAFSEHPLLNIHRMNGTLCEPTKILPHKQTGSH
jgi:hypothetical protein